MIFCTLKPLKYSVLEQFVRWTIKSPSFDFFLGIGQLSHIGRYRVGGWGITPPSSHTKPKSKKHAALLPVNKSNLTSSLHHKQM